MILLGSDLSAFSQLLWSFHEADWPTRHDQEDIPYELIGELVSKITPDDWIKMYESNFKDHRKRK